jgi:diguanylate cyclase (GGDEF)-like protein/PAS domain S-box-containing protein
MSVGTWQPAGGSAGTTVEQRFQAVFDLSCVAMHWYDAEMRRIVRVNDAYTELTGYSKQELLQKTFVELCHPDDVPLVLQVNAALRDARIPSQTHECRLIRKDGGIVWGARTVTALREEDGNGTLVFSIIQDITQRKQSEARLAYLACHDQLTGLFNRRGISETIDAAAAKASPDNGFAVLYLDLDDFKEVNDTLGHPLGDALLVEVAARLSGCVGSRDLVSRLGGDEFAIMTGSGSTCHAHADRLARTIEEAFLRPFMVQGHSLRLRVSIGIALAPQNGTTALELERRADMALYAAKSESAVSHRFFDRQMGRTLRNRAALRTDLGHALERDEFTLHYQPVVDVARNAICCFEALLRWQHPARGIIAPGDFIPLAEEMGLIGAIGEWVLRTACREAAGWPSGVNVSVNLSPAQFRSNVLPLTIAAALGENGLSPSRLEIEITESVLLNYSDANVAALHELRALGVTIALDDFGIGYSSLGYLQRFPFHKLKIDRSFVRGAEERGRARGVVKGIIALGHSLGIRITAEGVETEQQAWRMRDKGCEELQGFFFSPPVPAAMVAAVLAAWDPGKLARAS